jgi:hypothetical protein
MRPHRPQFKMVSASYSILAAELDGLAQSSLRILIPVPAIDSPPTQRKRRADLRRQRAAQRFGM